MAKIPEWHKILAFLIVNNPGVSKKEIAKQLNRTPETISRALRTKGIKDLITELTAANKEACQEMSRDFAKKQAVLIEKSYNHMLDIMQMEVNEDNPGLIREKTDISKACLKGFGEFVDKSEVKNTNTVIKVTRKKRSADNS